MHGRSSCKLVSDRAGRARASGGVRGNNAQHIDCIAEDRRAETFAENFCSDPIARDRSRSDAPLE
jgi:hypothetical protein